jgi:hypothetical protein
MNKAQRMVKIDEDGHASDNEVVVNLVMSAVQNVVDTTRQVFCLQRRRHVELFHDSLVDLLSTHEAKADKKLVTWFSDRGVKA